jgi:ATP-dependent DNA helicase RecG
VKDTQETVEETVEKIIKLLKDNPQISQRELANITGLTQRGIEWDISKLKDSGQLERIGPDKGGYWKVLKQLEKRFWPQRTQRGTKVK